MMKNIHNSTDTVERPVLNLSGDVDRFLNTLMNVTESKPAHYVREAPGQTEEGLAGISRVNTMAEFSASLIHELITQPIAATLFDADACSIRVAFDPPTLHDTERRPGIVETTRSAQRTSPNGCACPSRRVHRNVNS
jgi:hypothetical protein